MDIKLNKLHFSIDDIGLSLRYLAREKPQSMFDMRLFGKLRQWNMQYGLKTTLYCFAVTEDFLISEIPEFYKHEFEKAKDWLRFGYHSKFNTPFADEYGTEAGFELCQKTFKKLNCGKSDILRLHYWCGCNEQKRFLKNSGINTLLYPDDDCFKYNDNDEFEHCGLNHWRTRILFENLKEVDDANLFAGIKERICAFTHEQVFDIQAEKIEKAVKIYLNDGYEFI